MVTNMLNKDFIWRQAAVTMGTTEGRCQMMAKERIHIDFDYDRVNKTVMVVSNTNGAGLTLADLHNKFVKQYGGGVLRYRPEY